MIVVPSPPSAPASASPRPALYGCAYADVEDRAGLGEALAGALGGDGTTIIRVASRRAANVALHRDLQAAVAAALA